MDITVETNFKWIPTLTTSLMPMTDVTERTGFLSKRRRSNSKLRTPDGSFTFHLYTVKNESLALIGDSLA